MASKNFAAPYKIINSRKFRMNSIDPGDTGNIKSKDKAEKLLKQQSERLNELQELLYAQDTWSVLIIFQAMDAAGKDGTIKHVMSGINPQGCQVFSFKSPSPEELDHDFLWRTTCRLPERGRIGIFNRSYYEEALVVRVHPEWLKNQKIPVRCLPKKLDDLWKQRFESMNDLERHLSRNGTLVLKFFLHLSPREQAERFLSRLDSPEKHWKFSTADLAERKHWRDYMHAYEDMIRHTSTDCGRWHVVPADHKWYARLVVSSTIIEAMEKLDLHFPVVSEDRKKELKALRNQLKKELK